MVAESVSFNCRHRCRPNIPEGAECYICLNQQYGQQLRGDLVRMCACRGPHTGFIHVRCLVAMAESRGEDDEKMYDEVIGYCGLCRQQFMGPLWVALQRAQWLRNAARAKTVTNDTHRMAIKNLGAALMDNKRYKEALDVYGDYLGQLRKFYPQNHGLTIEAEECIVDTRRMKAQGEGRVDESIIEELGRVYDLKVHNLGRDSLGTLATARSLANALLVNNQLDAAEQLYLDVLPAHRRVMGEMHECTLECRCFLVSVKTARGNLAEARALRDTLNPIIRRLWSPKSP